MYKLYKAYIFPHFDYCSTVWHFCSANNRDNLEALGKSILRFILNDLESPYNVLLDRVNCLQLHDQRICKFLTILYKSLFFTSYLVYEKHVLVPLCVETIYWKCLNLRLQILVSTPLLIWQQKSGILYRIL